MVYLVMLHIGIYQHRSYIITFIVLFSGRFTPSGGGRSRRAAATGSSGEGVCCSAGPRGRGHGSKPSSRIGSEEPSASSESESSDNETELSKVDLY